MDLLSSPLDHSLLYSIPLLLLLPVLYLFLHHLPTKSTNLPSSATPQYSILGVLPQYLRNRHRLLEWFTEVLAAGPTLTMVFQAPGQDIGVITADPANVEHVLKTKFGNYPKGEGNRFKSADFLGDGIFNTDGELWRSQRKTASFEFNTRSLRNFVVDSVQFEIEHRLLPLLSRVAAKEEVVDLQHVLERFAFDNICKVAFGVDPATLAGKEDHRRDACEVPPGFMEAFDEAQRSLMERFLDAFAVTWRIKKLLDVGSERRLRRSTTIVHDFATAIVRSRMAAPRTAAQHHDLLSRFVSAMGPGCTEEFLRDVVVNIMLAGRETTSSSLTWFFWILSSRPDVRSNILDEIKSVREKKSLSGGCFSFDELREMHYLHAAITESLRLYPPVPMDTVSCEEDDVLPDGTFVGKGWFVSYSSYSMGRMERVWGKDFSEYKPARWLEKGVFRPESPYRFPVFHAGPRMCLGKEMAYIQMKSIVASVMERFEVEVGSTGDVGTTPGHVLSMTLRMKGGLPVTVRENNV